MENLLKLAYESLLKFGNMVPDFLTKLVEVWKYRMDVQLWAAIGCLIIAGILLVFLIISINRHWGEIKMLWVVFLIFTIIFIAIGIGLLIDRFLIIKYIETIPEAFFLKKLLSSS